MFDYAERRRRLSERMRAAGVDVLFLGLSADLEYLSGVERGIPFFGQSSYPHGWVAGGFFRPDADPVFVLPRMVVDVRPAGAPGRRDRRRQRDRRRVTRSSSASRRVWAAAGAVAVGDRVWAETTLNLGRVFGFERLRTGRRSSTSSGASRRRTSSTRWLAPAGPSSGRWPPSRRVSSPA